MNNIINEMLQNYEIKNFEDEKNALIEIIQEIVLCGLSRGRILQRSRFLWWYSPKNLLWFR
jgi:hypothetical protein